MKRLALVVIGLLAVTACGRGQQVASAAGRDIKQLPPETVPTSLEGLNVKYEDVRAGLDSVERTYVGSAGLWSLRREDDQVQATLQIVRFFDEPRYRGTAFRNSILTQIGSTLPQETRMGDQVVYRSAGTQQTTALWFKNQGMFLLSVRDDFPAPRALMRSTLEIGFGS